MDEVCGRKGREGHGGKAQIRKIGKAERGWSEKAGKRKIGKYGKV
jgi:hypothetical protein